MRQVSFVSLSFASCVTCIVAFGCAGSAPQAAAPQAAAPAKPAPVASSTPAASASSDAQPSEPAQDAVITRSVADRVFAPRIAYMVNYPISGAKDVADHKCSVKFPAPEAKANCMEKERNKFTADVLVFEKSDEGQSLTIYKRTGNALAQMSKSKLALGEDTTENLVVKVESEKGWRPIFAGKKQFSVHFRDEYSVELEDPQYGHLVYDARIGLID
jgi:hypothetical protein